MSGKSDKDMLNPSILMQWGLAPAAERGTRGSEWQGRRHVSYIFPWWSVGNF